MVPENDQQYTHFCATDIRVPQTEMWGLCLKVLDRVLKANWGTLIKPEAVSN